MEGLDSGGPTGRGQVIGELPRVSPWASVDRPSGAGGRGSGKGFVLSQVPKSEGPGAPQIVVS